MDKKTELKNGQFDILVSLQEEMLIDGTGFYYGFELTQSEFATIEKLYDFPSLNNGFRFEATEMFGVEYSETPSTVVVFDTTNEKNFGICTTHNGYHAIVVERNMLASILYAIVLPQIKAENCNLIEATENGFESEEINYLSGEPTINDLLPNQNGKMLSHKDSFANDAVLNVPNDRLY